MYIVYIYVYMSIYIGLCANTRIRMYEIRPCIYIYIYIYIYAYAVFVFEGLSFCDLCEFGRPGERHAAVPFLWR